MKSDSAEFIFRKKVCYFSRQCLLKFLAREREMNCFVPIDVFSFFNFVFVMKITGEFAHCLFRNYAYICS